MARIPLTTEQIQEILSKKKKPSKYKNKAVFHDGIRFASTKEGSYYLLLKNKRSKHEVQFFLMQVPFRLPGQSKYLADFMVVYADGNIEFIDVKGRDTAMSILKRKQVKDLYGVDVVIV